MMAVGAGRWRCYGSPAVHVAWDWIEMGVGVHGEPGAYAMMTLMFLVWEDFVDGVGCRWWMGSVPLGFWWEVVLLIERWALGVGPCL